MNKFVWVQPLSPLSIFCREWGVCFGVSILAFFCASVLMTGFPEGLIPNIVYPYVYAGDGLSHSWMAQRAIEGWVFDNARSGFPFGSDFRDYPGSDSGNLLIIKMFGVLGLGYQAAFNLFYLLTFSLVAVSSYIVARSFGVNKIWAFFCGMVYSFASFHFQRLAHVFYASYFVAPFFFYLCGMVYFSSATWSFSSLNYSRLFLASLFLIFLSSFGVYYALFGVILIFFSAIFAAVKNGRLASLWFGAAIIAFVCVGVGINVFPNILNKLESGSNPEVAQRSPVEAEIYSFKPVQLLLPQLDHRIPMLDALAKKYASSYSVNENHTSNLGAIGSVGFILLLGVLSFKILGRSVDDRLVFFAFLGIVLLFFGTVGGGGTIFSSLISSSIRGWNRLSIFLLFSTIFVFVFVIQKIVESNSRFARNFMQLILAVALLFAAYYDQTRPPCVGCNDHLARVFSIDKYFYEKIENHVGPGGAVYQLPYIPFPESPVVNGISPYDLLVGFLHTRHVYWSSGGMKGREGDLFYRALAKESIDKQVEVIKKLGFRGVYVDKRAYPDFGKEIIADLTNALGVPPMFEREFGEIAFFGIENTVSPSLHGKSANQIMQHAEYVVDRLGVRSDSSPQDPIYFSKGVWPRFVKNVTGLSSVEHWGRWSDANLSRIVVIETVDPLPSSFSLDLQVSPYGKNGFQDVVVRAGSVEHKFKITEPAENVVIRFDGVKNGVNKIEFIPVEPVSPKELGFGDDYRKLGIGFIKIKFGSI